MLGCPPFALLPLSPCLTVKFPSRHQDLSTAKTQNERKKHCRAPCADYRAFHLFICLPCNTSAPFFIVVLITEMRTFESSQRGAGNFPCQIHVINWGMHDETKECVSSGPTPRWLMFLSSFVFLQEKSPLLRASICEAKGLE